MRKILATLVVVAIVGATVLVIAALAGATPGEDHAKKGPDKTTGKGHGRSEPKPDDRRSEPKPDDRRSEPKPGHRRSEPKPGHRRSEPKPDRKGERVLFALLKGRNEIGADGRRGAGDPDGRGGFTALIANDQVCFGLTVDNIATPIAAHIHRGKPSQNGPIVVTLTPPALATRAPRAAVCRPTPATRRSCGKS